MSNLSVLDRLTLAVGKARQPTARFADLHPVLDASVGALEGLPWPVLKRGRELAAAVWQESLCDAEALEFDSSTDSSTQRSKLIAEIEEWMQAARRAG
jgi:hypothetical protein